MNEKRFNSNDNKYRLEILTQWIKEKEDRLKVIKNANVKKLCIRELNFLKKEYNSMQCK